MNILKKKHRKKIFFQIMFVLLQICIHGASLNLYSSDHMLGTCPNLLIGRCPLQHSASKTYKKLSKRNQNTHGNNIIRKHCDAFKLYNHN